MRCPSLSGTHCGHGGKFDGSFFRRYACPECAHHVSGFWDFCGGGPALLPDDFLDWVEDEAVPHAGLNVEVECPHCGPVWVPRRDQE